MTNYTAYHDQDTPPANYPYTGVFQHVAREFQMDKSDVAAFVGLDEDIMERAGRILKDPEAAGLKPQQWQPKTFQTMAALIEVYRLFDGVVEIREFLNSPSAGLDDHTPKDIVINGDEHDIGEMANALRYNF